MSERKEKIAELYYRSGSIKFGAFPLSIHNDHPDLPLSPWYLHYPKPDEPGAELMPDLHYLVGEAFYEMSEAQSPPIRPVRIAGLPKGALPLGESYARHYPQYPHNLLRFAKIQHPDGRTEFTEPEGEYTYGDSLTPCEDHVSGARNNRLFVAHARNLGFTVTKVFAVVDRQQGGVANLAAEDVDLLAIFTGDEMLEYGLAENHITLATFEEVQQYRAENQYGLAGLK